MTVHVRPEQVFTLNRNGCSLWAGICIRIYFAEIDGQFVLLLGGSGKRNQDREIAKARARLKDFEQRTK